MGTFTKAYAQEYETRACLKCESYSEEWEGEYGGYYCGSFCLENERYSNLKSFPFKKKMPCFQLGFWHSRFTELVGEASLESVDKCRGFFYFKQSDADGNLPPDVEAEFQKELEEHRKKYGHPDDL